MRTISKFLILFIVGYMFYNDIISVTKFSFTCKDPTISRPFVGDTIDVRSFFLHVSLGPLVILLLVELFKEKSFTQLKKTTIFLYYKECILGSIFIIGIVEVLKCITKHPRPHFLDSCRPDSNYVCKEGDLITEFTCTNPNMTLFYYNDLTKSFPSGHTAVSVFLALYCCYIIQAHVPKQSLAKPILCGICLIWSFLFSMSRIMDGRHHWWDVLAGAVLGVISAFYTVCSPEKRLRMLQKTINYRK